MSEKVYTIGELKEALESFNDDTHIRVNDDGQRCVPNLRYIERLDTVEL